MRLAAIALVAVTLAACDSAAVPSPSLQLVTRPAPELESLAPGVSLPNCVDLFTAPPYDSFRPVPGISVRAIDKAHFAITNATSRTYYFRAFQWTTEDNLVCGRGVIAHDATNGPIGSGATVQGMGGSTPDSPMSVAIWASPCGDGCQAVPIGEFVVPISAIEPPLPGST